MGIAQQNDRFKYLEDRIEEHGGLEHLEESEEWFSLSDKVDHPIADMPYFDLYMHRTRFFKASVYFDSEQVVDEEVEEPQVRSIEVSFCIPKHHYGEDEELPPIHKAYED